MSVICLEDDKFVIVRWICAFLIALRCSDSSDFVCAAVRLGCHTGQAHSSTGRITVRKKESRSSRPAPERFSCLTKCSLDAAFDVMVFIVSCIFASISVFTSTSVL